MTRFEYLHFVTNFLQRKSDSNVLTNRFPVSMLSNNTSYMIVTSFHSFPCLFINFQNPRTRIRTSFLQNCRIPHFPRIHLREAWIPELCIVRVRYVFKIQASQSYRLAIPHKTNNVCNLRRQFPHKAEPLSCNSMNTQQSLANLVQQTSLR